MYKKLNSTETLIQRTTTEAPQGHMYYIGLDVHKKTSATASKMRLVISTKKARSEQRDANSTAG